MRAGKGGYGYVKALISGMFLGRDPARAENGYCEMNLRYSLGLDKTGYDNRHISISPMLSEAEGRLTPCDFERHASGPSSSFVFFLISTQFSSFNLRLYIVHS